MKNRKIIIGNWKMNPLAPKEAEKLFNKIAKSISRIKKTEIIICPPFVYLERLKKISKKIKLGAQNAFVGDVGAFTGEVSGEMLYNLGVRYVILGHSERRARGETGGEINKKIKSALSASLTPILCVGENSRDDNHEYFNIVKSQMLECLDGIRKNTISKIIFAYEPVWAISSTPGRRDAMPEDAREMAVFIRKTISDITGPQVANQAGVIYGGSVTEKDVGDFLQSGGVDGVLVGKASLNVEKFVKIINVAENIS